MSDPVMCQCSLLKYDHLEFEVHCHLHVQKDLDFHRDDIEEACFWRAFNKKQLAFAEILKSLLSESFRRAWFKRAFGELSENLSDQQITLDPTGSKH